AVNAYWVCRILFSVGFTLFAVENVVGAEMKQLGLLVAANFGQPFGRLGINRKSLRTLSFREINICERGSINQNVKLEHFEFVMDFLGCGQIELRAIETRHVKLVPIRPTQRCSETAACTNNYYFLSVHVRLAAKPSIR